MIQIAFLGAGRMASAMIHGIINKGHYQPDEIGCASASGESASRLAQKTGAHSIHNLEKLLAEAAVIVLACKPQQLSQIDPTLRDYLSGRLVLSILAGTPIRKLAGKFPGATNYIRAMPNTPGQIGAGVTGFASQSPLIAKEKVIIENILSSLGKIIYLPEDQLDAVTALSGSGPAYVFEFIAALTQGGIDVGLQPDTARLLATETILGATRFLAQSGETPETLRDQVTSKGGTTFAGLEVMQSHGFQQIIKDTIQAAKDRSVELAELP